MKLNKLLIICGPTATGKTRLGLHLSKIFDGELVSADSRQVYKGMDIGTGKDKQSLALWAKQKNVMVWGYDLVLANEEFSVAQYITFAQAKIDEIWKRGKLPIIVGGTGLYIKALIEGIETVGVEKDDDLRSALNEKSVQELFEILKVLDPEKALKMNESDVKNKRRLIRAIEIGHQQIEKEKGKDKQGLALSVKKLNSKLRIDDFLMIGLKMDREKLNKKIRLRVKKRVEEGFENEVKGLLAGGVNFEMQSMSGMGYRQYGEYLEKKIGRDEYLEKWIKAEEQYAKRQMVWFKKDERIRWFDVGDEDYEKMVEKLVKKWYI